VGPARPCALVAFVALASLGAARMAPAASDASATGASATDADAARLLVAAWPDAVLTEWPAHARGQGRTGPALEPACAQAAKGLQRCLMVEEAGKRRLATGEDIARWGSRGGAERRAAAVARGALDGLVETPVPEMPGRTLFVRSAGDGLDTALVASPRAVHDRFGAATVMAFPDAHTTLVWRRGDAQLDKVLAVAVRRAWEASDRPVSPAIYRWNGDGLVEWAAARPSEPPTP